MKLPKVSGGVSRFGVFTAAEKTRELLSIQPSGACGTGWSSGLVPERWGNANFNPACEEHDKCYDTCGKSKEHCDDVFKSELHRRCDRSYSSKWHVVQRRLCKEAANTYHSAVHRMGGDAYRAAQKASGC